MQEGRSKCMEPTFSFLRKTKVLNNQLKYLVMVIPTKISACGNESKKEATALFKYMMVDI